MSLSCNNIVKTHKVSYFIQILTTGLPVSKTLIEYNRNNLEENDEEEKKSMEFEFIENKNDQENDENAIDLRWSDIQGEDKNHFAMANLIESLEKQAEEEIFFQKITRRLHHYEIYQKRRKD